MTRRAFFSNAPITSFLSHWNQFENPAVGVAVEPVLWRRNKLADPLAILPVEEPAALVQDLLPPLAHLEKFVQRAQLNFQKPG